MKIRTAKHQWINELGNRGNQEDAVYPKHQEASTESPLFILCDGMGGHDHGEVASQLVCDVLPKYLLSHWNGGVFSDDILRDGLEEVKEQIDKQDNGSIRQMGTTMTLLCIHQGGVTMAHIGDSRIYHVRPKEHLILYKSRDHSLAYDLYLSGEINYDELKTYKKNVITRAIMPGQDRPFKADITHTTDVKAGDYFLLCSDGILENMSDNELVALLASDLSDEDKKALLIEKTRNNQDNHSAILVRIVEVEQENGDGALLNDESTSRFNSIILEREFHQQGQSAEQLPRTKKSRRNPLGWIAIFAVFTIIAVLLLLLFGIV